MTPSAEIEALEAEAQHWRNRVALLRAKLYRQPTSSARLRESERVLEGAEQRLREARAREQP